ncbi:Retrovirus-related Pol polyprotein from transposon TNT 1-94 [Gossypium australe]|uniref:Retrovirus-related Pol polyprotein from transposon TNT 1-94 n=1 Tax=Gossypium australe TaxID=47621 RepID=A0A5B6VDC4_9ROSI|nr:Retrovirus-related Pol polyprotein from transposon TNT 1-94 [Gossypium australe]
MHKLNLHIGKASSPIFEPIKPLKIMIGVKQCLKIGCDWIYHIKRYSDGSIHKFKAYLVVKGFH